MEITKQYLEDNYLSGKSIPQIAKEIGQSATSLYKLLKKYNIAVRGKKGLTLTDYAEKQFGHWKVLKKHPKKHSTWICQCKCGIIRDVKSSNFLSGGSTQCNNCVKKGYGGISGTLWCEIRNSAIQRKLELSITVEYVWNLYLQQQKKCALTGLPIEITGRQKNLKITRKKTTASLDRIDSTKGYIEGNLQWTYKKINMMKQGYSQSEFIHLCKLVASHEV